MARSGTADIHGLVGHLFGEVTTTGTAYFGSESLSNNSTFTKKVAGLVLFWTFILRTDLNQVSFWIGYHRRTLSPRFVARRID